MNTYPPPRALRHHGFTLVELLVAMVILATLVAIAVSSYIRQSREARRTEAKTAILDLAGREERTFSTTNAYSANPATLGYTGAGFPLAIGGGFYTLNVAVTAGVAGGAPATYTITANAAGDQVNDTVCATYTYTQAGVATTADSGGADSTPTCWR